jgi:hypothetical protein
MIFTSTSSASGQSPLVGALFDMFSDENNNDGHSNQSNATGNSSSHSPILAALMAAASSVAMTSPQSGSDESSLTSFAIKRALFPVANSSQSTAALPAPCLSNISSPVSLPSPSLPLSTLSNDSNVLHTLPSKRSRPDIRSIKRALFVDKNEVDHAGNLSLVKEQLRVQQQVDNQRWNFDFENGRPLSARDQSQNRYEWNPLMANASTTCTSVVSKPVMQPETPVKRKTSIDGKFTVQSQHLFLLSLSLCLLPLLHPKHHWHVSRAIRSTARIPLHDFKVIRL